MPKKDGWAPTGFGGRLRRVRVAAGLSQEQLAERAGCHPMTVAKLERGAQEPAWPLVLALAKALGATCEAFNGGAADEPRESRPPGRPPKPDEPDKPTPQKGRPRKPRKDAEK